MKLQIIHQNILSKFRADRDKDIADYEKGALLNTPPTQTSPSQPHRTVVSTEGKDYKNYPDYLVACAYMRVKPQEYDIWLAWHRW